MSKLSSLYQATVIEKPKTTLVILALIVIGLMAGLPRLKLDASSDSLTLENDQDIDFFREIGQRYQSGDFLVVTYTPKAPLFSEPALADLKAMRDEFMEVEGVASINSILDVPLLYSPLQTLTEVAEGTRTLLTPGVDYEQAKEEFLTSPIYKELLLSPSGKTTLLQLVLEVDNTFIELVRERDRLRLKRKRLGLSAEEQTALDKVSKEFLDYRTARDARDRERVAEVRAIADKYRDDAEIFLGGVSMITADMIAFIESDMVVFGIGIILFMLGTLAIIFRQARFVFLPFFTCVISVAMMLGYLSWIDWRMTLISNNFVPLLLIITLAITIHLVVRYRELHASHPDWERQALVMETVRLMVKPCLYTALTTVVAFVSLVVSGIKPVIDFGWMMTIGLGVAFVLSFTLIPAALMVLPKGEPKDKGDNSGALTVKFSKFAEHYGKTVIAISFIAGVGAVYGISNLVVENRFIDYFDESTEIYQGMSAIDQRLGGTMPMDIVIDVDPDSIAAEASFGDDFGDDDAFGDDDPFAEEDPFAAADSSGEYSVGDATTDEMDPFSEADSFDEPDPFADPKPVAEEDPFAESDPFSEQNPDSVPNTSYWFTVAGLEEIEQLHDYLESLPEVGKVLSVATAYKVARDLNGGSLNDFELAIMQSALPTDITDILLSPYLSFEANQTRINILAKETSPELKRVELLEKVRRYAVEEVGLKPEQVKLNGLLVLYNNVLQSLFRSQIVTMGAVFVGIMLMFLVLFRSLRFSLAAIIPNILAAGAVLGTMGIVGIPLDLMNIMVAAITVGMGVDHAIHYIHRYKQEFEKDRNYVAAMHRSHASIGRAMYYTSVTIIAGFSILALSKFIPSIYFGLLTSLAMFAAIIGSLTLLPKLILLFKPLGPEAQTSASNEKATKPVETVDEGDHGNLNVALSKS